ncbi:helix-turn-helix domain-containing protein [Paenibacillus hodogayensis]|uniref:Helix-turn-helix domain-containing protein n=1 Tax=Paenibacillus hodogayensis TaxID=279208 RepID=A0ABV5W6S1_9BACL
MSKKNREKDLELIAFGITLKNIRKEKGYTQEQLSDYSRIDRSFISELENGEKAPTLLTLISLAKALRIKPSMLMQILEFELDKLTQK